MILEEAPDAVLFDWDGTLVDSWPVINEAMDRTLAAMGRAPRPPGRGPARGYRSLRETFPAMFGDRWEQAREVFQAAYEAVHLERVRKIDGAEETLEAFRGLCGRLGVVSNKTGRNLRKEAAHLGWDGLFEGRLVGAADAARDKPAAEPVLLALAGTGIAPSRKVWLVGDTWVDVACGRAAGCRTVLVGGLDGAGREIADHPPDAAFPSLFELREVVKRLERS